MKIDLSKENFVCIIYSKNIIQIQNKCCEQRNDNDLYRFQEDVRLARKKDFN